MIYLPLSFFLFSSSRGIFQKRKYQQQQKCVCENGMEENMKERCLEINDEYACGDDNGDVEAWKETRTRRPCLQRQRLQQPIERPTTVLSSS